MNENGPEAPRKSMDWSSLTLYLISIFAVVLCLWIVRPFLAGVTWAVVLAIVTQRPHAWISARLRNRTAAATVMLVLVTLSIVVPTLMVLLSAGNHALILLHGAQSGMAEQELRQWIGGHPSLNHALQYAMDNLDVNSAMDRSASAVAGKAGAILGNAISAFTQAIVMLFILFFLYRDKDVALGFVRNVIPLEGGEADYLLKRVTGAINALALGRFAVAGLQGLLSGIAFALLGVGGATLLGAATMLFALVPAVGAFVIWLPVVFYLAAIHHWVQAFILLGAGSLVISTLDNILYPILVGSHLRLHTAPIFLAMLGGVFLFGVSGLILGPIAFSVTETLLLIWRKRDGGDPLPGSALEE